MKYSYYLPLVSRSTGRKFVLQGSYLEDQDGSIVLPSGEVCDRWETFPH